MTSARVRPVATPRLRAGAVDLAVAVIALLTMAWMTLLAPAFTDYEVEIEPTFNALLAGHVGHALQIVPIYGISLFTEFPVAALGHALGGAMGMYRWAAIPGAFAVATLALMGARWMREAGRSRRDQLAIILLACASPLLAQAWSVGHHEEVLVAAATVGAVILLAEADGRRLPMLLGAALLGAAIAGKLWPLAVFPLALAQARTRREALQVGAVTVGVAALLLAPVVLAHISFFTANVSAVGSDIFCPGQVWWFFGKVNPHWLDPRQGITPTEVVTMSYRVGPGWVAAIGTKLIMLTGGALAATWWWRSRRVAIPADRAARTASLLLLLAAIVWWRGLLDPWYQAYYLNAGLLALALADARRGRLPIAAIIAWSLFWVLNGQNNLLVNWHPDLRSAVWIAWTVPLGVWTTVRALRSAG